MFIRQTDAKHSLVEIIEPSSLIGILHFFSTVDTN